MEDGNCINLRVVLEGDGKGPVAGHRARVMDAATGREIGGVYRVEFAADLDGAAYVVIHAYPVAVDVTATGYLCPNEGVGVELKGDGEVRYMRLPVVVETTELGGPEDASRSYAPVEG